ncbi:MAG: hypothetical protein ACTSQ0_06230 [Candidatus Heimdallarchaeota archaeon]
MSDIISKIVNQSWYENNFSEKCYHKFDIDSCNEEGLAVCSECGIDFDELRSK